MTNGDRPQDVGRSHRKRGAPSPETTALLADYQEAMRVELRATLIEIRGAVAPTGLLDSEFTASEVVTRPNLTDRARMWDLAIKLGRELGSAIDADPVPVTPDSATSTPRTRRRRPDFG